jgi:NAD(P)-dependent dehydrogenase (short-subunit alcohol dehydrogenase family)
MKLAGKVGIVTGSGQGVGRGIALALAAEGASVVLMSRTGARVEQVAQEILDRGGEALPIEGDVTKLADIEGTLEKTIETYGRLDILVNNAQHIPRGLILDTPDSEAQAAWESGPLATLRFMRLAHPHLRPGSAIINIGSRAGLRPDPIGQGAYAAAKEAIRAFSRAAAMEWGPDGIRVNVVLPFATSAALERMERENPEAFARTKNATALGRVGDPEVDIGRAVAFLVGPDAGFITGTTIPVDGGKSFVR